VKHLLLESLYYISAILSSVEYMDGRND